MDDILEGTFDAETLGKNATLKAFIKALATPTSKKTGKPIPEMDITISLDEFKQYFKKTQESTSSSLSGLHYGHYIACCEDDDLATILLTFMTVPFQYGFSLKRWENSVHCMLQKETKPFIH